MPGVRCTRSPCAKGSKHTAVTTGSPVSSGIPCTMVLRLIPRSPRRRIRLVTVIGELTAVRTRSGSQNLRRLDTSNGCQDHTALPSAAPPQKAFDDLVPVRRSFSEGGSAPLVLRALDRSQAKACPAITFARRAAASTASRPNVRDDGQRPSFRAGTAEISGGDLPDGTSEIFFAQGLDKDSSNLPVGQITGRLRGASQPKLPRQTQLPSHRSRRQCPLMACKTDIAQLDRDVRQ
jgi:hypothetical protein